MAQIKKVVVRGDFACGFDHSFSSYTSGARALVELEPGDDVEAEIVKAQEMVNELAAEDALLFKEKHDKVRAHVTRHNK